MKRKINKVGLIVLGVSVILFLMYCGTDISSNQYLGDLPGISKKYTEEIDAMKKDIKENTDINNAFTLNKELKNLKEEAKNAIKDYLANNNLAPLPIKVNAADYPFSIKEVIVNPKNSSISNLKLIAKIKFIRNMTRDEIKDMYGGFGETIYAYAKALDKDGNILEKTRFGFKIPYSNEEYRAKEEMEAEMKAKLYKFPDMIKFAKLVFISRDEFSAK